MRATSQEDMYNTTALKFALPRYQQSLTTKYLGRSLIYRPTTSTTMTLALREASEGAPHGTIIFAETQTEGRGRAGRNWFSAPHENLYFSLVVRPKDFMGMLKLNFATGIAIAKACETAGAKVGIKWPNDIWYQNKWKVSGMLIDSSSQGSELTAIVGVGVNVNSQMRTTPMAAEATSVRDIVGQSVERETLLAAILNQLESLLLQDMSSIMSEYRRWDILCGKQVVVKPKGKESNEGQYEATAVNFTDSGCLQVRTLAGEVVDLSTGDVSIRLS